jgi:hypothetical protein
MWIGFNWLRVRTKMGSCEQGKEWTFGLHKRRYISWPHERLLASQEGLYCMRLVSQPTVAQLVKKFPLLWKRNFIGAFKKFCHWTLRWVRWIQSTPSHPKSLKRSLSFRFSNPNVVCYCYFVIIIIIIIIIKFLYNTYDGRLHPKPPNSVSNCYHNMATLGMTETSDTTSWIKIQVTVLQKNWRFLI